MTDVVIYFHLSNSMQNESLLVKKIVLLPCLPRTGDYIHLDINNLAQQVLQVEFFANNPYVIITVAPLTCTGNYSKVVQALTETGWTLEEGVVPDIMKYQHS